MSPGVKGSIGDSHNDVSSFQMIFHAQQPTKIFHRSCFTTSDPLKGCCECNIETISVRNLAGFETP